MPVWFIIAVAVLVSIEACVWIHAWRTCDGVLVRNAFDFPACVAGGKGK